MWARNGRWILPEMPDFHVAFRNLLHAVNIRHGTDGFTSPPKEGELRIFSPWKIRRLRPGLHPRTWVPKANTEADNRALLKSVQCEYKIWFLLSFFMWLLLVHIILYLLWCLVWVLQTLIYIVLKNQSLPPCNLSLSVSFHQCCILIFHSCTIQGVVLFHGT